MEGTEVGSSEQGADRVAGTVSVDNEKCQGHARCWHIAPDFFTLDDEGYSNIGVHKPFTESMRALVAEGIGACPESALRFDD